MDMSIQPVKPSKSVGTKIPFGEANEEHKTIFVSLSNGDFNDKTDTRDMESIRWELEEGCQDYVIITRRELSVDEYKQICDILDKK